MKIILQLLANFPIPCKSPAVQYSVRRILQLRGSASYSMAVLFLTFYKNGEAKLATDVVRGGRPSSSYNLIVQMNSMQHQLTNIYPRTLAAEHRICIATYLCPIIQFRGFEPPMRLHH